MSSQIRHALAQQKEMKREMERRLGDEREKLADYLICYLLSAREVMKDSEELRYHTPSRSSTKDEDDVLTKKEIACQSYHHTEKLSWQRYLEQMWNGWYNSFGFERTMEDIERSSINERVTPEMLTNKYNKYQEILKKQASKRGAREIFLLENLNKK